MEVLAHFFHGRIEEIAIEIPNISVKGNFILMSQVEGA
jgi:hypothetical protein